MQRAPRAYRTSCATNTQNKATKQTNHANNNNDKTRFQAGSIFVASIIVIPSIDTY